MDDDEPRDKTVWTAQSLRKWVLDMSVTLNNLSGGALRPVKRWCVVLHEYLGRRAARLLQPGCGGEFQPVLYSYQSDGWSSWVNSRNNSTTGDVTIQRDGKTRPNICWMILVENPNSF